MNHGEIVQAGTPSDIYEFPNSQFVADFIGSVNMFEGRLIEDEPDHVRIESGELGGTIFVDHGISAPPEAHRLGGAAAGEDLHVDARRRRAARKPWRAPR